MMIVVTGASSSGKSAFAEQCLMGMGEKQRIYAATMIAWDEECRERIRKHRRMRKEKRFETVECPVDLERTEFPESSAVLLECMSNLAANEMYREDMEASADRPSDGAQPSASCRPSGGAQLFASCRPSDGELHARAERARERILRGIRKVKNRTADLVVVTNEVFGDTGRYGEETRMYQKLLGSLNQELFEMADQVYEVVCGIPVSVKGKNTLEFRDRRKIHMRLIVGGAYQGKEAFAWKLLGKEKDSSLEADGAADDLEEAFKKQVVLNFHEYIRRFSDGSCGNAEKSRQEMEKFIGRLVRENPDAVVVADEIGCGIVPMEPGDRLWRDLAGEAVQMLAREAKEVYRVIGGLPQKLKGGSL